MMKIYYKFNMVEIALAIVVIAIGLSSVLVLFPVGINATRAAVEENIVPDVSAVVVNFVRGEYLKNWDTARSTFPTLEDQDEGKTPLKEGENTPSFSDVVFGNELIGELKKSSTSGVYQYYRVMKDSENNITDEFTATVQIWRPSATDLVDDSKKGNAPLYLPDVFNKTLKTAPNVKYDSGEGNSNLSLHPELSGGAAPVFEKFADSVLVKISYGDVEKTFRIDVYNSAYEIKAAP